MIHEFWYIYYDRGGQPTKWSGAFSDEQAARAHAAAAKQAYPQYTFDVRLGFTKANEHVQ